jgi:hypothetical protein
MYHGQRQPHYHGVCVRGGGQHPPSFTAAFLTFSSTCDADRLFMIRYILFDVRIMALIAIVVRCWRHEHAPSLRAGAMQQGRQRPLEASAR